MKVMVNNMYVSGSLKNKTINFYKENMNDFSYNSFSTPDVLLNYDGNLIFSPWRNYISITLQNKQKKYIEEGIKKTKKLIVQKELSNLRKDIIDVIDTLRCTNQKYAYELSLKIIDFKDLIEYLNNLESLNQIDLDIIIQLFINNKTYTKDDIFDAKAHKFKIDERDITDSLLYEITLLGEFIAPHRVKYIAKYLYKYNEFSKYVLPTYFAIKDDKQAQSFLNNCRTSNLDFDQIEKNAILNHVPTNLLIRR